MGSVDVIVVGAGPAGWAVADGCARRGLHTALVDPDPHARWPATYGLWADQCAALPPGSTVLPASAVHAAGRSLARGYAVLDNDSVLSAFTRSPLATVMDRVVSAAYGPRGATVALASGARLAGAVVIDASGARRVLSGGPPRGTRAEQTAYGLMVPAASAAGLVAPGEAVFMRWCGSTFLYAVPLPGGRVLLEETSLARRPGLGLDELRSRLIARLAAAGIRADADTVERVRFALDVPVPPVWRRGAVPFGVAAGMIHPATGYSVADALLTAPRVADAIARALPRGPLAASAAGRAAVWSPAARAVHALRRRGLRTLLALPAERVPEFFAEFFALPDDLQRAYLSGREDVRGTAAAMAALFRRAPWRVRAAMVAAR
ncbi:lycopene cyclase family protein [Actinokineospora sp.]|uniref:lycopene cyclase family protein n=1 Tax=Actinokineospora sp. TaxID=1872133 RepID=UPI0040384117